MSDGPSIWQLTKRSPGLDLNSAYCYLLLCSHFCETCLVAESDGVLSGYVTAYVPPGRPDTVFLWQIAVDAESRGKGLGRRLVDALLDRLPEEITFLEATVTPANAASRGLFQSVARDRGTRLTESAFFGSELFPPGRSNSSGHEPELLIRVGPIGRMEEMDRNSNR